MKIKGFITAASALMLLFVARISRRSGPDVEVQRERRCR